MNENVQKLVENTIKDMLLGNTALTFMFALPLAYISKHGLDAGVWVVTAFVAPGLCCVGTWIVSRIDHHAMALFNSRWARRVYVCYVLMSAEFLIIYSITQIIKSILRT